MGVCPQCQTEYPDGVTTCEKDGAELVDAAVLAAADRDIQPGEQVGEYRIESKIGEGGFGTVYRAVHPVIGKTAAIKVLSRRFSSDPEMVSRFVAEARAVNRIQNKNIIDIFAFGAMPDGRQYYVMELLEGTTLEQYLAERGRLSPEEAMPILLGVARALDAAHAAGIAHRDLKPDNVFLAHDEDRGLWPKLLDFGIAKLLGDTGVEHKTRTGVPLGTPFYMSPEQCRGMRVDQRTDIYSFGVLTYQLLSGTLPFAGDSYMDVMMKHINEELPPVSSRSSALTAAFDAPLARMMAKDPAKRPASMMDALRDLAEAARAAGHDVQLPASSGLAQSGKRSPVHSALTPAEHAQLESADTLAQATTASGDTMDRAAARTRRGLGLPVAIGGAVAAAAAIALALSATHGKSSAAPTPTASITALRPSAAASPAPPPAPSVTPAPPSQSAIVVQPAEPVQIKLSVQSTPKHVVVYLGKKKLGTAPGPLLLDRGHKKLSLVLKADGYLPRTVKFTPTEDGVISATLRKIVHHAAPPHHAHHPSTSNKPKTPADLEF